ncbi:MAG: ImmA/IrrE family metallo-endopeptidase [Gaiellaceae bacterium]
MRIAIGKAAEARQTLSPDLDEALERAGLMVFVRKLAGRLREFYTGDSIVLSDQLSRAECRELSAHALGHHLLHTGNQWHQQGRTYSRANYQERQADVFAAFFLIPDDELNDVLAQTPEPHSLAEEFGVPEPFIRFRLQLHAARLEAVR